PSLVAFARSHTLFLSDPPRAAPRRALVAPATGVAATQLEGRHAFSVGCDGRSNCDGRARHSAPRDGLGGFFPPVPLLPNASLWVNLGRVQKIANEDKREEHGRWHEHSRDRDC